MTLPSCYRCGCQPCACEDEITLYCGDCLQLLAAMPEASVDLVFGSPPYEDARTYGMDFRLKGQDWVDWMVACTQASLRICRGLVAFVVEGRTNSFRWSATPALFMADLHRAGVHLRKPPIYRRVGIPGSGGPDWLRNDYEFVICATNGGKLPWSDNTAMGSPCKYPPGGRMSYQNADGVRRNHKTGKRLISRRGSNGGRDSGIYAPPKKANPGNIIHCKVGGGMMGDPLTHENEAPFPESLVAFFVRSFCPKGGIVCDPFSGSGTTLAVARKQGRRAIGIDVRESQCELAARRIGQKVMF